MPRSKMVSRCGNPLSEVQYEKDVVESVVEQNIFHQKLVNCKMIPPKISKLINSCSNTATKRCSTPLGGV